MRFSWPLIALSAVVAACHSGPGRPPLTPASLLGGQPAIAYPPDLFAKHVEGEVMLYLVVDSSGAPVRDSIRVAKSSGQSAFDAAALQAAAELHFMPAHRGSVPVTSAIQVPIRFQLPDSTGTASRDHE
ncbi:MAG TPA: TonB family protein [Gemmatimonadales bacterium]|nr:TonB family protein [Gemmatimonadales bacterium]